MTLTQLNTLIEGIATDVSGINRYFYGPISDENLNDSQDYPALIQLIDSYSIVGALGQERPQWPINLYLVDQIYNDPDEATWKAKYEELAGYVEQVYMKLREAGTGTSYGFILSDADIQPVLHWENATGVVGWLLSVTIQDEDIIECEPFTGSSLCFEISDATWVQIKACMSAAQLSDAEADIGGGGGDVTLNVNGSLFTTITAPDTFDLPVLQGGSPVGSKVGDNWVIPDCPEYDLSIPQAPLTVAVDADKTIQVQNSAGSNFNADQVSAAEVGDTINIALVDGFVRIVWNGGSSDETFLRNVNPRVDLVDSGGNFVPAPTITEPSAATFNVALQSVPVKINTGAVTEDTVSPAWTGYDIMLIDQEGNPVTPTNIDGATDREITLTLPQLVADFSVDDSTPTVGEEITFTDDSSDSPDHWAWDFGDGTFDQVQNPTKTYLVPGVYDVRLFAANKTADLAGFEEKENYITAAGILDTYTGAVMGWAAVLLYRTSTADYIRLRESGGGTTDEIGYLNGEADTAAILTHTGANNGTVERVYMNDGSGRFFTQGTAGNQPTIVSSGTLITNKGVPSLRFNGTTNFMTMTDFAYWGGDRSKIYVAVVVKPQSTTSPSNYIVAHWIATGNQRSWAILHDGTTNQLAARYTTDGSSGTDQIHFFNSLTAGEVCVIGVQIDTSLTADNRIRAWKNGVAMSFASRTGSSTGNLHDSTGNANMGAINNGAGFFEGDIIGCPVVIPSDQTANRAAIEQYLMDYHGIT